MSGGEVQRIFGRRVTLSAGAVASPPILMRSGIGPAAHLRAVGIEPLVDLPGVGANLRDQPIASVPLIPNEGGWDISHPFGQVILRYTTSGSDEFNDMQIYGAGNVPVGALEPEAAAMLGSAVFIGPGASLQRPRTAGRLTLINADAHIQPRIELTFLSDAEDTRRMVEALRLS